MLLRDWRGGRHRFSARPGEVTGHLGPNGPGKSTTMKMVTRKYALLLGRLISGLCLLYAFNRHRAQSAVIYFEEIPEERMTTLGLDA
jgi:ABC-type multidrug transport system ATPase subunit